MSKLNLLELKTAREVLRAWASKYADPHDDYVRKAKGILDDPNREWKDAEQLEFAKLKYQKMDTQNIDNYRMINIVTDALNSNDKMLTVLKESYQTWEKNIAYNGVQQTEMMRGQAAMLQEIFETIKTLIEE